MPGAIHCPWTYPLTNSWKYLDTLVNYTSSFLNAAVQLHYASTHSSNPLNSITVYPNPSQGNFQIQSSLSASKKFDIQIFSMQGRFIDNRMGLVAGKSINISDLPRGTYLVRISDSNHSKSQVLILE